MQAQAVATVALPLTVTVAGQTTSFALDLDTGLTQVLQDGTYSYLYGNGRISQEGAAPEYFLGDALGSVRQMAGQTGEIVYAASYSPYGEVLTEQGTSQTSYGYTGEMTDSHTMLVYLRSRMYSPYLGSFIRPDSFIVNPYQSAGLNKYLYVQDNPINAIDPSGYYRDDVVHFNLTLTLAIQESSIYCPKCAIGPNGDYFSVLVAAGDQHVDDEDTILDSKIHTELHFKSHMDAWSDINRTIKYTDPYLFGAALHGLQDYWSHTYEGYYPPLGHAWDTAHAFATNPSIEAERSQTMVADILTKLWQKGEIDSPTKEALLEKLSYLGPGITTLSTSKLFDLWLRERPGPARTRKAADWKDDFGFFPDEYYPFTWRDQQMIWETKKALIEYFIALSGKD